MASIIEGIYNKFCSGDSLTNDDIDVGINHFRPMGEMLLRSGPVFRLAAQEALRVADRLEGFRDARKSK